MAKLWTAQDVADYLGVQLTTLYVWRTRGQGPRAVRVGKYLRYREQDVLDWVEARFEKEAV